MSRISLAALANTKSGAALGGAPGSIEPAQIKTNNQRTKLDKAMPVRTLQPWTFQKVQPTLWEGGLDFRLDFLASQIDPQMRGKPT